jgi:RimJ/RimL family protein N-acetyltransferase
MNACSLQSRRILLRRWRNEDFDAFARLSASPVVMEHLMPLPDRAASDAVVHRINEHFAQYDFGFWAVELPGTCPFIGFVGLDHVRFTAHFTPAVHIAWRLDPTYWGHGYASEAAGMALTDGFIRIGLNEIVAMTVPANHRSRRVMERLGMKRAECDDFDHPTVPDGHRLKRRVLYRLERTEWQDTAADVRSSE